MDRPHSEEPADDTSSWKRQLHGCRRKDQVEIEDEVVQGHSTPVSGRTRTAPAPPMPVLFPLQCALFPYLPVRQLLVQDVGDEHVAGDMGNADIRFSLHNCNLRGNAASPENRHFTGFYRDRITEIRFM